ncbi:MAG TPA: hydrogenase maturation protease [Anaerovoracaceae bacterium]|nr:hydrogenase maturation protease [Anaerovoracaceae bacterium]
MKKIFLGFHQEQDVERVLVLGIGNRLMGDDGVGVHVAEAIGRSYRPEPPAYGFFSGNVRVLAGETDVDYCLRELADSDACIIIDAACSGKEPGYVDVIDLGTALAQITAAPGIHDFNLLRAMKREGLLKEGILIAVEIDRADFSLELSPPLQARFQDILREVKLIIDGCLLTYGVRGFA